VNYSYVRNPADIRNYLSGASIVAFDFETAPLPAFRDDSKAALDANRAHIIGVSLSVAETTGIYIPLRHADGGNADPQSSFLCLLSWFGRTPM
jgi:hypothetical protein